MPTPTPSRRREDILRRFRVFPRLFAIFYMIAMYETLDWAMDVDNLTTQQAGMVSVVVGAAAAFFKFYVDSGKTDE